MSSKAKAISQNVRGEECFNQGDFNGAFDAFSEAVELDPKLAVAHNNMGVILWRKGDTQRAIDHFATAIELEPGDRDAVVNLGEVWEELGNSSKALDVYRVFLDIKQSDSEISTKIELLESEKFDQDRKLLDDVSKEIEIIRQGEKHLAKQELREAMTCFSQVLELNPENLEALNNLGVVALQLNQNDNAIKFFSQAYDICPSDTKTLNNLGGHFLSINKPHLALEFFRVLSKQSNDPETFNNMGNCFQQLGHLSEALDSYQRSLSLNSQQPAVIKIVKEFEALVSHENGNMAESALEPVISKVSLPIVRLGDNDCGWSIIPNLLDQNSIIYCVGCGENISFDMDLMTTIGCSVHAFDPTPKSLNYLRSLKLPENYIIHEVGLAHFDGSAQFNPPVNSEHVSHTLCERKATSDRAITVSLKRLSTIMSELGHNHLDLLKMDIEGAEYEVISDILNSNIKIGQICVEFHHFLDNHTVEKTLQAILLLNQAGYLLFNSYGNTDYCFVHKSLIGVEKNRKPFRIRGSSECLKRGGDGFVGTSDNENSFAKRSYSKHVEVWEKDHLLEGRLRVHESWFREDTADFWRHERMYEPVFSCLLHRCSMKWLTVGDGRYGLDAIRMKRRGFEHVLPTDIGGTLLEKAKAKGLIEDYRVENAEELSFSDDSFDYVLCKESYHHFPRPMLALYEMLRVARKGVVLIEPQDVFIDPPYTAGESSPSYEPDGNYLYTLSRRELEKVAYGLNLHAVAFKNINDVYLKGVELLIAKESDPVFLKFKRLVEEGERKCELQEQKYNFLLAVIFRDEPSAEDEKGFSGGGWTFKRLPRNPQHV